VSGEGDAPRAIFDEASRDALLDLIMTLMEAIIDGDFAEATTRRALAALLAGRSDQAAEILHATSTKWEDTSERLKAAVEAYRTLSAALYKGG
jgi:predicted kinase